MCIRTSRQRHIAALFRGPCRSVVLSAWVSVCERCEKCYPACLDPVPCSVAMPGLGAQIIMILGFKGVKALPVGQSSAVHLSGTCSMQQLVMLSSHAAVLARPGRPRIAMSQSSFPSRHGESSKYGWLGAVFVTDCPVALCTESRCVQCACLGPAGHQSPRTGNMQASVCGDGMFHAPEIPG